MQPASAFICGLCFCLVFVNSLFAQSVPRERRIKLVAAEPLVVDPVQFEFDPDGRIWAVGFRGWMLDIDGQGEGDLKCDSKKLVGSYGRPGNPEHTDNGLMHGIDNWMHSADSNLRHRFRDGKLIEERSFNRGQWGMTQDDYGRRFYNYENRPLHADLYPSHYAFRNRHLRVGRSTPGLNHTVVPRLDEVYPIRVTPGITLGGNELCPDGTLRTFTIARLSKGAR